MHGEVTTAPEQDVEEQEAGQPDMAQAFTVALDTEQQHLDLVRSWLRQQVLEEAG